MTRQHACFQYPATLLFLSIGYALCALVIAWAPAISNLQHLLSDSAVQSSIDLALLLRSPAGAQILGYIAVIVVAYLGWGITCWIASVGYARLLRQNAHPLLLLTSMHVLGWVGLIAANAHAFPLSDTGRLFQRFSSVRLAGFTANLWFASLSALLVGSGLLYSLAAISRLSKTTTLRAGGFCTILAAIAIGILNIGNRPAAAGHRNPALPNIVIIGIDSLRPDYAGIDNPAQSGMPALQNWLKNATIYRHVYTPVARTFPSWISILTGKQPFESGARFNLTSRSLIDDSGSLPRLLQKQGYKTVYATDDVRFSNIDKSYGFDERIGPVIGAGDFVISTIGDTPLGNLLLLTPLGKYLLPSVYGNRADFETYGPGTFVSRLAAEKKSARPLFLAIHLTLPHWPWAWRNSAEFARRHPCSNDCYYKWAVERADAQFKSVLASLHRAGTLDNAIVFVLSDHGESLQDDPAIGDFPHLNLPEEAPRPFWPTLPVLNGHGTDIFRLQQSHILLAMKDMRTRPNPVIDNRFLQTTDIKRLALTAAGLHTHSFSDTGYGGSKPRYLFFQSGFFVPGIGAGKNIHAQRVMQRGIGFYRLDPETGYLQIRPQAMGQILQSLQYGVMDPPWLAASLPLDGKRICVLINQKTRQWAAYRDCKPDIWEKSPHHSLFVELQDYTAKAMQPPDRLP